VVAMRRCSFGMAPPTVSDSPDVVRQSDVEAGSSMDFCSAAFGRTAAMSRTRVANRRVRFAATW